MKKILSICLLFLCSVMLFAAETSYDIGQILYVSVKTIKSGKVTFYYGDKVIVDETSGKKILVHLEEDNSVSGWISNGSVSKKKIIKTGDGSKVTASSKELSLAGKGFSETAENLFKNDNPEIDFTKVDEIEKIVISEEELKVFIEEGKLCEN